MQAFAAFTLTLYLCSSFFVHVADAKIYKWVDEDGRTQYTDTPPPSANHEGEQLAQTLNTSTGSPLSNSITLKIRRLFLQKDFKTLNTLLATYQKDAADDIQKEGVLVTAYTAFEMHNESFGTLFDAWVKETPNTYQPYLARAHFYYRLGWEARGHSYRNETSDQSISKMTGYFNQSTEDLKSSITIYPNSALPYITLIGISMNIGDLNKTLQVLQQALSIAPASYSVRTKYLQSLQPRWGGSIKLMQLFASSSQKYVEDNPKIRLLIGEVYAEVASIERKAKNYKKADELYAKSLTFGESHQLFFDQAYSSYFQENYDQALVNINMAIQLYAESGNYYYWRSKILTKQLAYPDAVKNLQYAEQLNPYSTKFQKRKVWLSNKLVRKAYDLGQNGDVSKQIEYCTLALQLEPNHAKAYSRRARGYVRQNKLQLALEDAKEAIRLQPKNVTSYDLIDYILAFDEDWKSIIKYWSQYIALNPNDGHAYVERGGAYYRSGNLQAAVTDAKTSADLGNPMGKRLYKKFKNKVK